VNAPPFCEVRGNEILFSIIDVYEDGNRVKQEQERTKNSLEATARWLSEDVTKFNRTLLSSLEPEFQKRKNEILKQRKIAASIGVPFRQKTNIPSTFAIPTTVRQKIVPKPAASVGPFVPEPTLDDSVYQNILQVIQETGRVFERLPRVYTDKDEESLRDHPILQLEPRFEGSTTGETFNKVGKTDILMRYEGKNIFVAECKFWRGIKSHLEALDQLLSYLTWRDSKTALVCFVENKEIMAVLKAIEDGTPDHPCFVTARGKHEESWFNYEFHLPGDNGRRVFVAIMCFHLPKS
jgi:hypothetical protein